MRLGKFGFGGTRREGRQQPIRRRMKSQGSRGSTIETIEVSIYD
jgi:hypothetical protein